MTGPRSASEAGGVGHRPSAKGRLTGCPTKQEWVQVNLDTGHMIPLRCDRNRCPWCGPRRAIRVATAIEMANPAWGFTLTGLDETWAVNHPSLAKVMRSMRDTYQVTVAWHLEENPRGMGCHLHGWGRGARPDEGVLSEMAGRAGLGQVVAVKSARGYYGYGMKEVTALVEEDDVRVIKPPLDRYLDRNGGRLVHASRGFWVDRNGRPTDLRGALRESARRHHGSSSGEPSAWVKCHRSKVNDVLGGRR